ncbi:unnamed protein product [Brassica oleracea]
MGSSPPSGVEPGSMTIGPQGPYKTSYHITIFLWLTHDYVECFY